MEGLPLKMKMIWNKCKVIECTENPVHIYRN